MPVSQRVLLGDVPGAAVLALLQYLYTAHCPLTRILLPHVRQLADRSVLTMFSALFNMKTELTVFTFLLVLLYPVQNYSQEKINLHCLKC